MRKIFTQTIALALISFISISAKAQLKATDLFGTYKFTATMTDVAEGCPFTAESEVTITKDSFYDLEICGVAGSTGSFCAIIKGNAIQVNNPQGGNYDAWGSTSICLSNVDGDNPFYYSQETGNVDVSYAMTVDENGDIRMPDFTIVKVADYNAVKGEIICRFSNVVLKLVAKQEIIVPSIAGTWDFKATYNMSNYYPEEAQELGNEFVIELVEGADTKTYTATITMNDYAIINNVAATFDGDVLCIPFEYVRVSAKSYLAVANAENKLALKGDLKFKYKKEGLMGLDASIYYPNVIDLNAEDPFERTEPEEGKEKGSIIYANYVLDGSAKLRGMIADFDFARTWQATIDGIYNYTSDYTFPYDEKTPGNIVIEKSAFDGEYYMIEFFGFDTYSLNYGGIPCEVSADDPKTLKIMIDQSNLLGMLSMTDTEIIYAALFDMNGQQSQTWIELSVQDDGTAKIEPFCIGQKHFDMNTYTYTMDPASDFLAYIYGANCADGIENIKSQTKAGYAIYNLNGIRQNELQRGVNIVRRDGKVIKVIK